MDGSAMQDGWTAIPNELLDNMQSLGNAELRLLLTVYRKTVGFRKDADVISFTQFESATGLARQHIKTGLDRLIERGLIAREDAKRGSFCYRLVTLGNQSLTVTSSPRLPDPVTLGNQSLVTLGNTQKKEKEKKESIAPVASGDAPTPAPEMTEPTPIRKPRKQKAAAPATPPAEPSEHKQLMTAYAEVLGYKFPNGGKEAAGAQRLLDAGYTVEQVISAYCEMKAQAFWASKHLSLHNVAQDIGAIVNRQEARQRAAAGRANGAHTNGAYTHHVAPADPGILDAAEMRRQMAELLGGGK